MQGVWIQSLVGELKSHIPDSMAKKTQKPEWLEEEKRLSIMIEKAGGSQSKTGK